MSVKQVLLCWYSLKPDKNNQNNGKNPLQKSVTIENLQPKIRNNGAMTNSRKENGQAKV